MNIAISPGFFCSIEMEIETALVSTILSLRALRPNQCYSLGLELKAAILDSCSDSGNSEFLVLQLQSWGIRNPNSQCHSSELRVVKPPAFTVSDAQQSEFSGLPDFYPSGFAVLPNSQLFVVLHFPQISSFWTFMFRSLCSLSLPSQYLDCPSQCQDPTDCALTLSLKLITHFPGGAVRYVRRFQPREPCLPFVSPAQLALPVM